jgi:electron transfer flavoprotein alpha subunit
MQLIHYNNAMRCMSTKRALLYLERTADGAISGRSNLALLSATKSVPGVAHVNAITFGAVTKPFPLPGISRLFLHGEPDVPSEVQSAMLQDLLAKEPHDIVLGTHCTAARMVLPRVAAVRDAAFLSDVIAVCKETGLLRRPIYAGIHVILPIKRKCIGHLPGQERSSLSDGAGVVL